jgi:UDP-N-acetylmuramoylalanine--D-glutamate ligase
MTDTTNGMTLIAGCGVSGRAAARLAARLGIPFALLDEQDNDSLRAFAASLPGKPEAVFFGFHAQDELPRFERTVLSPGFRAGNPVRAKLAERSDRLLGELEFALDSCGKPFVGITGTNGKTTTTELTAELFRAAGIRACACGNNGYAMSDAAIDCLDGKLDLPVVEISSFQLELMPVPHPAAAAVLNLASDHIDRHGSMDAYAAAKFKLLGDPAAVCVVNSCIRDRFHPAGAGQKLFTFSAGMPADFSVRDGALAFRGRTIIPVEKLALKGVHNQENALAALALLAAVRGEDAIFRPAVTDALAKFESGPHRLERFLTADGIQYINDSKATNPHAVNAALAAVGGDRNVVILLGGLDKAMDFEELAPSLKHLKHAVVFGSCGQKIAAYLEKNAVPFSMCGSFPEAVGKAVSCASPGDVVLLSPATASMDMFRDYRDRGDQFKTLCRKFAARKDPAMEQTAK